MKLLRIYLKQRLQPLLWLALTLYLVLMSVPKSALGLGTSLVFLGLFWQLLLLRLYDDLMQVKHDLGKTNRNYTHKESRFFLFLYLILLLTATIFATSFYSFSLAYALMSFWVVNHALYLLYVHNPIFAQLLPLFKYPILSCFVLRYFSGEHAISISMLAIIALVVWVSIIVFEIIDDPFFFIPKHYILPLQGIAFIGIAMIYPNSLQSWAVFGFMLVSMVLTHFKVSGHAYLFFVCLVLAKMFMV